jgi:hypothetical protein
MATHHEYDTTPLINISAEPTVTPKQRHVLQSWRFA